MKTKSNFSKQRELTQIQRELFVKYYPVVTKVVNSMRAKLPSHADIDELHSAGVSGLADAVSRLNPKMEKSYDGYIATRVRGAIIDELRSLDYMSRSARSDAKNLERMRDSLEQKLGRAPKDSELRKAMGITQKQFDKVRRRTQSCSFISINDTPSSTDNDSASPASFAESIADENIKTAVEEVEKRELAESVRRNLALLPERQRKILEGYYFQEKKLAEIAKEFGLTEARICQIHSQALSSLRPHFN